MVDWSYAIKVLPNLLRVTTTTIQLALLGVGAGTIIGTIVGLIRVNKTKILYPLATLYVEVIRGTPMLVQLVLIFYGLPQIIGFRLEPFTAAFLTFGINSGAYTSEIVRGGVQSIDRGQMEAARSLGMTYLQAMWYIILPQAFRRILPPLGNEFIILLKDTALASTVTMQELMRTGQIHVARTGQPFPIYIMVALIYLAMTLPLSLVVRNLERRMGAGDKGI
ncbi:MAG: amino acid ABC transporter permease [Bacillota bacterium]|nr:amino acid ABC transporter permease [Bacillota bacterium]